MISSERKRGPVILRAWADVRAEWVPSQREGSTLLGVVAAGECGERGHAAIFFGRSFMIFEP